MKLPPLLGHWLASQVVGVGGACTALRTTERRGSLAQYVKHFLETVPVCFLSSIHDNYVSITYS